MNAKQLDREIAKAKRAVEKMRKRGEFLPVYASGKAAETHRRKLVARIPRRERKTLKLWFPVVITTTDYDSIEVLADAVAGDLQRVLQHLHGVATRTLPPRRGNRARPMGRP